MKRLVAVIVMCLLAANVGGVSLTHHLCGKLSQYLSPTGKKKQHNCCCKGSSEDKGCCKTKIVKLKVDDGQSLAKQIQLYTPIVADVLPVQVNVPVSPVEITSPVAFLVERIHPPPLILPVRQHVLHGVFLI